ncbi:hypothetical protein GCM10027049_01650 [Mucilaginibacter puniceus]
MKKISFLSILSLFTFSLFAQSNYEIQVYASPTMKKGLTMFELHSNYTISGSTTSSGPELPTNHAIHETIEITHGWTNWFETGFYIFNSIGNDGRTAYVGSHIRPRVAAPASWNWPIGVSISTEFGFQKSAFDANTASVEIRPIVDKTWNKFYVAVNPTIEKSFSGPDENRGFIFSPNVKGSYNVSNMVAIGLEYYGSTGPFFHYDSFQQQEHQLFAATDINFGPAWEFNSGIGYGFTSSTDKAIVKLILGRRF